MPTATAPAPTVRSPGDDEAGGGRTGLLLLVAAAVVALMALAVWWIVDDADTDVPAGAPYAVAEPAEVPYAVSPAGVTFTMERFAPARAGDWPVVVLTDNEAPGLAYQEGADPVDEGRDGTEALARAVAERGVVVYAPGYIASYRGETVLTDRVCALRAATDDAADLGAAAGSVALVGVDRGAPLGAAIALGGPGIAATGERCAVAGDAGPSAFVGYGPWSYDPSLFQAAVSVDPFELVEASAPADAAAFWFPHDIDDEGRFTAEGAFLDTRSGDWAFLADELTAAGYPVAAPVVGSGTELVDVIVDAAYGETG